MDEYLIRIIVRLVRVHDEMGYACFEDAAQRALVAVAQTVHLDALKKAGMKQPELGEGVLPFPLHASRQHAGHGEPVA